MGVPVRVSNFNALSPARRLLNTQVTIQCTITAVSAFSPADVIGKLNIAVSSGRFAKMIAELSGLHVSGVTNGHVADLSPTSSPIVPHGTFSPIARSQRKQLLI